MTLLPPPQPLIPLPCWEQKKSEAETRRNYSDHIIYFFLIFIFPVIKVIHERALRQAEVLSPAGSSQVTFLRTSIYFLIWETG